MGGPGSGRGWYSKKRLVEDCVILGVNEWMKMGVLKKGILLSSQWQPEDFTTNGFFVDFEVDCTDMSGPSVFLSFFIRSTTRRAQHRVCLTTTTPYGGGLRWWFLCPSVHQRVICDKRVARLYLPIGETVFGCRESIF